VSQPAYPALYDPAGKKLYSLLGTASFVVGRSETADLTVLDVTCSRQQFRIVRAEGRYYVEPLSRTNPTYLNDRPVGQRTPLAHQDQLGAGSSRFVFLAQQPSGAAGRSDVPAPGPAPGKAAPRPTPGPSASPPPLMTVMAGPGSVPLPPPPDEELGPIPLAGKMLIGREVGRVQVPLLHPQVSRVHAHITPENDRAVIVDLNSANGTFVNGQRIRKPTTVRRGDSIDIGPYALLFDGKALLPRTRSDNVELVARGVCREVTDRETGKPLKLLDDITLVIRPREFVCLLGPSGSGKSTLMSILSGRTLPDRGCVLVNGQDLHGHFDALKHDIAVVPQKDILHDSLSVGDALWYTARLRLPPDLGGDEVRRCIDDTLATVSLQQRRGTLIRHLSGGQVKRASLANEIMCKPSLLFLDEVTSGLDEQTDRDMMDLFRSVADTGKTVACITHSLANVERTCHLVVILTAGGKLAFVGKPAEALAYFAIQRLGDVYDRLAPPTATPEQLKAEPGVQKRLAEECATRWQQAFKKSPLYERYITARLPPQGQEPPPPARAGARTPGARGRLFLRQTALLTRRYFAIWRGDFLALLAMLGQSVLVAVLLGVLFGDLSGLAKPERAGRALNLLFLLAVTSFWFGCNNAAKEIVKERVIYTRERDFNVQALGYYCSKFLLLVLFSGLQTLVLALIVRAWCNPPGAFAGQCLFLLSLSVAGTALGLAISAAAPTEEMAITLIPVAIIPQIILSGMIAPVKGLSKTLARSLITVYWGNRGLDALLPEDLAKAAFPPLEQGSAPGASLVVCAHACVFVLAALGVLFWQGWRARGLGNLIRRVKAVTSSGR
jgi:ABC-type multidrug transport system ATPase subunit/pSer/pThr/pTyr-binding forkhead associated (FHA) protein